MPKHMTGEDTLVILKCQDVEKRRLEIAKEAHRVRKEANILKKKRCEEKATKNIYGVCLVLFSIMIC